MPIKKHDFIEIEYTGKLKENNIVFDTTSEEAAKNHNVFDENHKYSPIIICVGENGVIKGIDNFILGRELGEYKIEIPPENAFGKKNPELIQLIPGAKFKQHGINPVLGLQVNIDGIFGTVKNVSGGRILVDFNHPLSGKDVIYDVKISRIITDDKEKIRGFIKTAMGIEEIKVEIKDSAAIIDIDPKQKIPQGYEEEIIKKLKELINVKEIKFGKIIEQAP